MDSLLVKLDSSNLTNIFSLKSEEMLLGKSNAWTDDFYTII